MRVIVCVQCVCGGVRGEVCGVVASGEKLHELVFRDDGNAELLRLAVLGACRCGIVVDEVVGTLRHTARHLSALPLDVSLQLVAVFVVVHVAGDDKRLALAPVALRLLFRFVDGQLLQQVLHAGVVGVVAEEGNEACTLLRSDAVDGGKLVVEEAVRAASISSATL